MCFYNKVWHILRKIKQSIETVYVFIMYLADKDIKEIKETMIK